jgi:hypothetical protein
MKRLLLVCLCQCWLIACVVPRTVVDEARIRELLPGTWVEEEKGLFKGILFEKTYFKDGTAKGKVVPYRQVGNAVTHQAAIHFSSRWRLKGDLLESYDVTCSEKDRFKPTDVFQDRIIDINEKSMTWHDLTNGGVQSSFRWIGPDSDGMAVPRAVAKAYHDEVVGIRRQAE